MNECTVASKLSIMLLSPEYTPELSGGVGTCVQELAEGLCQTGCDVVVVSCTYRRPRIFKEANKTVHLLEPVARNSAAKQQSIVEGILAFNRSLVSYTRSLIAEQRPDAIHCQNWVTFPAGFELSCEFKIPLITAVHYLAEPIERWWGQTPDCGIVEQEQKMFRSAGNVVTVSVSMREIIQETYKAPVKRSIPVVYNGMDTQRFLNPVLAPDAAARLRQTIAAPDEKIILFCGRLNPQKGIPELLESAMIVMNEEPKACLVIAGEPDSKQTSMLVQDKLERNPSLKKRIKFLGKLPRKQLALLYQVADVAVTPSVYEPFGYAALEAMAAGVPVVASSAGGLAEIVQHERTGLLVPMKVEGNVRTADIRKLASAQSMLLRDADTAKQFGQAGQKRATEEFGLIQWGESMGRVYRDAIYNS